MRNSDAISVLLPAKDSAQVVKTITTAFLVIVWAGAIFWGGKTLFDYEKTPGANTLSPVMWPAESTIAHEKGKPILLMFLHPQCPCSRASLTELSVLMAKSKGRIDAAAVFILPNSSQAAMATEGLWDQAKSIQGLRVIEDKNGREAELFHAQTSGHTVFYDAVGKNQFSGGITGARGHVGKNPGRVAVENLVLNREIKTAMTWIFGCPLFRSNTQSSNTESAR